MLADDHDRATPIPQPSPNQPGTLGQQLAAIATSLYLGTRRDTSARDEWQDARSLCIPHARRADR